MIYAGCFFLTYKTLFQLSYFERFAWLADLAYGLIAIHVIGFFWCMTECAISLKGRLMGTFICAVPLVIGLEFLSPDSIKLNFWLRKSEYLARVAATPSSPDGRLSIVVFGYAVYLPSMPGGYLCATEIVYDNSNDVGLIAKTEDGRARVVPLGDNFYLRYPPCG
jgi:hypothetical protein